MLPAGRPGTGTLMHWLSEPLSYEFMQRGLAASLIVGVLCSVVGCYVVLRSMAFLGDALAHAILPGVAVAYLLGASLMLGALVAAVLVALGIAVLSRRGVLREDAAIGILFAAALSLGVVLISSMRNYAVDLTHILFGNVLGVRPAELGWIAILAAAALGLVVVFYRQFLVISFDPVLATTLRWPVDRLRTLQLVLIALTVVVSLQVVGVGLVAAMLVTPAATAYLFTRRLPAMMLASAAIGVLSAFGGLYLSYYADVASGAAIVLVATALFLPAYALAPTIEAVRSRQGPGARAARKASPQG
jgi:ABC-type Mn2+/Zn2+ transport system permease subunit